MRRALVLTALLLAACAPSPKSIEFGGGTMGTGFTVKLPGAAGRFDPDELHGQVSATLDEVNQQMSTYIEDSEISRFNANPSTDWQPVSWGFCMSVERALELSEFTDGAFDITAGPLVNLWGFGPEVQNFVPPARDDIEAAQAVVGYRKVETDCDVPAIRKQLPGVELDLSAWGKGLAADRVSDWMKAWGIEDYMIEIGGEIRVGGRNTKGRDWAIGIEIPRAGKREPYTVVHITDSAVATSGDYRNFFEYEGVRYSHEIDTRTGYPVTHDLAAVSIIDKSGARADALATGLLVLGPEAGLELATRENIAALFLTRTDTGIEETATPAFAGYRRTQ